MIRHPSTHVRAEDHGDHAVDSHIGLRGPGVADSADTRWLSSNEAASDAAISSQSAGEQGSSPSGLRSRSTPTGMGSGGAMMMSSGAAAFNGPASGPVPLGHGWGGRGSKVCPHVLSTLSKPGNLSPKGFCRVPCLEQVGKVRGWGEGQRCDRAISRIQACPVHMSQGSGREEGQVHGECCVVRHWDQLVMTWLDHERVSALLALACHSMSGRQNTVASHDLRGIWVYLGDAFS